MKFIKQFGIILAISFIGEIMNYLIPPPGSGKYLRSCSDASLSAFWNCTY